jgi:hypothetical protein
MAPQTPYGLLNQSQLFSTGNPAQERPPWVAADRKESGEPARLVKPQPEATELVPTETALQNQENPEQIGE